MFNQLPEQGAVLDQDPWYLYVLGKIAESYATKQQLEYEMNK